MSHEFDKRILQKKLPKLPEIQRMLWSCCNVSLGVDGEKTARPGVEHISETNINKWKLQCVAKNDNNNEE